MKIEHVAFNVADPNATARWYVEHLGLVVQRRVMQEPWAHFLADESGQVMLEIYGRNDIPVPDYASAHPGTLHLALLSSDVDADVERLTRAGCTLDGPVDRQPGGDVLAFLRDPWGFCLQLVNRAEPML
jgi:catechol 2,3-dioxygenase-like lactoylglutathione lyase family enzyme